MPQGHHFPTFLTAIKAWLAAATDAEVLTVASLVGAELYLRRLTTRIEPTQPSATPAPPEGGEKPSR